MTRRNLYAPQKIKNKILANWLTRPVRFIFEARLVLLVFTTLCPKNVHFLFFQ